MRSDERSAIPQILRWLSGVVAGIGIGLAITTVAFHNITVRDAEALNRLLPLPLGYDYTRCSTGCRMDAVYPTVWLCVVTCLPEETSDAP